VLLLFESLEEDENSIGFAWHKSICLISEDFIYKLRATHAKPNPTHTLFANLRRITETHTMIHCRLSIPFANMQGNDEQPDNSSLLQSRDGTEPLQIDIKWFPPKSEPRKPHTGHSFDFNTFLPGTVAMPNFIEAIVYKINGVMERLANYFRSTEKRGQEENRMVRLPSIS
jgi:hypothetical protein